jgi:TorA maturation chaperone TorD
MQTLDVSRIQPLSDEDLARADWYGLIGRLFSTPLDQADLARLSNAGSGINLLQLSQEQPGGLEHCFACLCQACLNAQPAQLKEEFDQVFVGTGKAEVFLNASFYQAGFLHEKPLVDLRSLLNRLGYARKDDIADTEDHLSLLCASMRRLILDRVPIAEQKTLFMGFLAEWFEQACDAIEGNGNTDFYKHAARLMRSFFAIERQSFDFEE